ncbi:2-succinyl-5-enolpyruvyl-6-hydroxy-3-cyclohexene-1-carboxylate synthase [Actinosynnema pretiosum]|nr:2-succinyl-5-enolpyruvyl-6-hydroxy-3-cyclohexene-1-carboxylate synthase [Actinosynnema pretiosum]
MLVDELVRNGVRHVVLSPGSRNAPLSFALHDAAVAGRLELHVRIDERSAGFLALGLALAGTPVAVTCTSGTAVANLHPAVLEAAHSGVPLIALTADRPVELHRAGASQTVRQDGALGLETLHLPVAERRAGQNALWRSLVCRAVAAARDGGPVHLNVPFRDPLTPEGGDWVEPLEGRPFDQPWTRTAPRSVTAPHPADHLGPRTLVVLGDAAVSARGALFPAGTQAPACENVTDVEAVCDLAARAGWPVVAEPTAPGRTVQHGSLLLNAGPLPERLRPDAVVVVGRATLSRGVQALLGSTPVVHVVTAASDWPDPKFSATHVSASLAPGAHEVDDDWLTAWRHADKVAGEVVAALLADEPWPTGMHVARAVVEALPPGSALFLGSSNPVRDVDFAAPPRQDAVVRANRGVAGIDGSVSTAIGLALECGPTTALMGDLTFLHDSNGLLIGPHERRPDLTVVVLNDDGGGIFALLEQGAPEHADSFERVFGTPHGTDLAALCAAHGVPHVLAGSAEELRSEITRPSGIRVVEIRAERAGLRELHKRLKTAVSSAVQ